MQTKINNIMDKATGWMTADEIAAKGKWRSVANVGVELQLMEKTGRVVRRKSPTVKQGNGMPATEWRHSDKRFDGDHVPAVTKMIKADPAPIFTQPAHDITIESNLRQQVAHLTDQLAGEKSNLQNTKAKLETAEAYNLRWLDLAREYECKTIQELRVFIGALVERAESLRLAKSANVALKILNEAMPGFGATFENLKSSDLPAGVRFTEELKGPFVVRTPNKPPRFTKKHANAHSAAMSAARQHGFAEVFALVPVGKAVRGAEWVAKVMK